MKKLLLPALLACAVAAAAPVARVQAQTISPCPVAPTATVISADITTDTKWTSNNIYLLSKFIYVRAGATLTIEPGTIIKGDKAGKGTLIVEPGAKIMAEGTVDKPIVFTSNEPAGSRNRGDWGGIILLGKAPTNLAGTPVIEGGVGSTYGGTDPNDNSGVLKYVRIEFPGIAFQPNSEINGLTMGGVGAGTTIDYVQVYASGDDSFEWFGGTVNAKHLVAVAATDDDFDTDNGFQGKIQYGLIIRESNTADVSGSTAFESDNDKDGSSRTPKTAPVFSNVTALLRTPIGAAANFTRSMHLRRDTEISIFNSVIAGWPKGLTLDGAPTQQNATAGKLVLKNNVMANMTTNFEAAGVTTYDVAGFWNAAANANTTYSGVGELGLRAGNDAPDADVIQDFTLPAASVLNTGAAYTDAKLTDSFFNKTGTFRGAFGATNWVAGWTNFNPQTTCYNRPGLTLASKSVSDQLQQLAVAPNPTAGTAQLSFNLKRSGTATVRVLDMTGRQVATLLTNGKLNAGTQSVTLPANLKSGVYMAVVTTNETSQSVRFVVAK
ncbi:T9SS type A sorting domain-containing protein [Hymenobacter rubripertinctus]|uniref:T9SS C-terminal target domain-containing protein n=1 Tax=Hymenobacter rubripertinctus TaxID=2029981 RepID=A0A418QUR0_9BACT|nr:T9SS type A sorting domain-containing protein [Hymenobacter rubripertinctus]RIY08894.1 T9SS C-terminal target domain-containing protein [Hymenobacter rubripertinctus]